LILVGLSFLFLNKQSNDQRIPASDQGLILPELIVDELDSNDGYEIYIGFEDDEKNICDEELEMILTLEPEGVKFFSDKVGDDHDHEDHQENEKKLVIEVSNGCERGFVSPIFMKSFCGNDTLNIEDDEGTAYELVNTLGHSIKDTPPPAWKVKSLTIGGEPVSMKNQLGLSQTVFNCR